MTRTERYHDLVRNYRGKLRGIWGEYEKTVAKLERYRGSRGYDEEKTKAEKARDSAIAELQGEFLTRFGNVIDGMKESALNMEMTAPTQEQLAILSALKMREGLTADELRQAGRSLRGCPVGLAVIDELAQKHEIYGVRSFGGESTSAILAHVDELAENARRLCKLSKCDSKREMVLAADVNSPSWTANALYSFRVDVDPESEARCMSVFGSVSDLESFSSAVNN